MQLFGDTRPQIFPLEAVDGFIAIDLPDAPTSGGGTRLAPDVSAQEALLLARAMTYKLAVLGLRVGGAKVVLRASPQEREAVLAAFRAEISPWLASGYLMTGPDLGTNEADFVGLPIPGGGEGITAGRQIDGVPAEEFMTGYAAAAAVGAAVSPSTGGDLHNCRVALEGFGKIGSGVARHLEERGARIVAVSTVDGCAVNPAGFATQDLLAERARHGDGLIRHIGGRIGTRELLWTTEADVLVPGARPGVLNEQRAAGVLARSIVPIANAPYSERGLAVLRMRSIATHADFIVSAGGAMAYLHPAVSRAASVEASLAELDRVMRECIVEAAGCSEGPYAGAVRLAQAFLASWRGDGQPLPVPPLAQEV
jgi:glutamate dehydrogenase (NAD(P)+)